MNNAEISANEQAQPSFKDLIALTKKIESGEANDQSLMDMMDLVQQLSDTCQSLFKGAREGDDLYVVQGREAGDDDDTVGLHFASGQNEADHLFLSNSLNISDDCIERNESSDGSDPDYLLIASDPIHLLLL